MRNKPSTTLLSYNSQAVVQWNDTLAFMDLIFSEEDCQYIWKVARKLDASGLERSREEALAAFKKRMAEMKRVKAEAAQRRLLEHQIHLSNVKILQLHNIPSLPKLSVTILDEQLNALREHFGDENVPKRSHRGLKTEKVKYLTEALKRHYSLPHTGQTPVTAQGSTLDTVEEGLIYVSTKSN
ncbi:hypothetical protein EST38_g9942 [Candolleomyces aberdarensis]|uniref:Uncharacterized protein n=1 Tax=Candolleomyces aberdarensis TaxID=2316362 RepID=A0A4Q2D8N8_9AGAR|nr:hypothetical protein EST38_g9942 [Candolleomyces aberdarensis]